MPLTTARLERPSAVLVGSIWCSEPHRRWPTWMIVLLVSRTAAHGNAGAAGGPPTKSLRLPLWRWRKCLHGLMLSSLPLAAPSPRSRPLEEVAGDAPAHRFDTTARGRAARLEQPQPARHESPPRAWRSSTRRRSSARFWCIDRVSMMRAMTRVEPRCFCALRSVAQGALRRAQRRSVMRDAE